MIDFGNTLKAAREAKGLSVKQVAESTHMMVQMVESLEREDFTRIVAPIYGRGFVKLYCEAVDLDPQPMVAEFMDIFTHKRPPTIHTRIPTPQEKAPPIATIQPASEPSAQPGPAPEPEPFAQPEPAGEPPVESPVVPVVKETPPEAELPFGSAAEPHPDKPLSPYQEFDFDGITRQPSPVSPRSPEPEAAKPLPKGPLCPSSEKPIRPAGPIHGQGLGNISDIAPNLKNSSYRTSGTTILPPAFWRILLVLAIAGALIWGVCHGIRKVFTATLTPPPKIDATREESALKKADSKPSRQVQQPTPAKPTANARTPIQIPPFYLD